MLTSSLSSPKRIDWILIVLIVVKFLLNFIIPSTVYELHRDEYLYYAQGLHLDFGYLENPPLIGLLSFISSLLGGSLFWIKFWPALFGSMTLWITWKMAGALGGNRYAKIIAALGILCSAYMRTHYLFQPNFLDIFFWSLTAYFLICFCNTRNERYLFALSFALALAFWSKYSVLFFGSALVLALLLSPYRIIFRHKRFWQAALLFFVLVLPNLIWQYMHRFPVIHHMNELRETQLRYLDRSGFLKEQILMLIPVLFVWLSGLVWLLYRRKYRVVGFTYLFVLVLLMMGSGKGYYALGAYPMLLAAGGVCLEGITVRKPIIRFGLAAVIIITGTLFIPILLPIQSPEAMAATNKRMKLDKLGLLKWEDQDNHLLQQDFADMLGWKELTGKAETFYNKLPKAEQEQTLVYGRNYGLSGSMQYYAADPSFRNKVIGDNGTFLLWIPEQVRFKNLLFVGQEMPHPDDAVFQHFEKITIIDSCTNPFSRQYGHKVIYFEHASDSAWQLAQSGLARMKAQFQR